MLATDRRIDTINPDGGCERIFYDGEGNRIKHVLPEYYDPEKDDGEGTSYEYDPAGRLAKITGPDGMMEEEYGYDLDRNMVSRSDALNQTSRYGYNLQGKLLWELAPAAEEEGELLYQKKLRLENQEGRIFFDFRYEYDLNGNRTLKSGSCLLPGEDSLKEQAVRYQYDGMNRLEKVDNAGREAYNYNCKNQLSSRKNNVETINYWYDLQGNVLEEASPLGKTEYRYNALNQQTAVFTKDGGIQENQYDAEYLRAEVYENGRRSRFLYYNGELLAESEPDETVTGRYILGYGVAAGWQKGKEGYHSYHLDEQNSTAYITDAGQEIENSYLYDAFGAIRGRQEGIHNRILYTGQQHDQVTGQYYLRARYYNPILGRFMQEDVYRGDGLNLYAYCHNNPVTYYDPSGYSYQKDMATTVPNMTYEQKVAALYTRQREYLQQKIETGTLKTSTSSLLSGELEVGSYDSFDQVSGDGLTPHHMPAANTIGNDNIGYNAGSAMNMEGQTHSNTFSYGMNEKNRPYDNALYNSLSYEDRLDFDQYDATKVYGVSRPHADQDEVAYALKKQREDAMNTYQENQQTNQEEVMGDEKC